MFRFSFTAGSTDTRKRNKKTGGIPTTRTDRRSCPASCPFNHGNGCYAAAGPEAIHWRKLDHAGLSFEALLALIRALPKGQLWRHNTAGDLPDPSTVAGRVAIADLVAANRGRRGFTYSHHRLTRDAVQWFRAATANGFTINASTESESAADSAVAKGLRVVLAVPSTIRRRFWRTPDGHPVVVCPAVTFPGRVTCATCQLCHGRPQNVVIAFPAHGSKKAAADRAIAAAQP